MILRLTISQFHFIYKRMTYIKNDFYNFIYKKKKKSLSIQFLFTRKRLLQYLFKKMI